MTTEAYVPHIDVVLQSLRITRERLDARSKVAIDPRLLVHILRQIVAAQPFDEAFYLATYDDVAQAHGRGEIGHLHAHFIEAGFFEGRLGADPAVDPAYYLATYPDVGRAIEGGQIASASAHFTQSGVAEARAPNAPGAEAMRLWMAVLRPDG